MRSLDIRHSDQKERHGHKDFGSEILCSDVCCVNGRACCYWGEIHSPRRSTRSVTIHGVKLEATQSGRVNFGEVAREEALQQETNYRSRAVPFNEQVEQSNPAIGLSQSEPSAPIALSAVSPGPSTMYQGLDDISDGTYHYIPLTRWARVSPRGFFSLYLTSMNWLDEG